MRTHEYCKKCGTEMEAEFVDIGIGFQQVTEARCSNQCYECETQELTSMEFTKEEWEDIYQWYLVVETDYSTELRETKIGEKIKNMLIEKYGDFK